MHQLRTKTFMTVTSCLVLLSIIAWYRRTYTIQNRRNHVPSKKRNIQWRLHLLAVALRILGLTARTTNQLSTTMVHIAVMLRICTFESVYDLRDRFLASLTRQIKLGTLGPTGQTVLSFVTKTPICPMTYRYFYSWRPPTHFETHPVFSFCGASWMLAFHLGVVQSLQCKWDLSDPSIRFCGASSGSLVAVGAACGLDMNFMLCEYKKMAKRGRQNTFGPIGKMTEYVRQALYNMLPDDAHLVVNHRVKIIASVPAENGRSVHRLPISSFSSKEALINTIMCSCYIPLYYENPPSLGSAALIHDPASEAWESACSECSARTSVTATKNTPYSTIPISTSNKMRICNENVAYKPVMFDGGLSDNFPCWFEADRSSTSTYCARKHDGYTVTVSPSPGLAVITPDIITHEVRKKDDGKNGSENGSSQIPNPSGPSLPVLHQPWATPPPSPIRDSCCESNTPESYTTNHLSRSSSSVHLCENCPPASSKQTYETVDHNGFPQIWSLFPPDTKGIDYMFDVGQQAARQWLHRCGYMVPP